ncbi:MAG TPA: large conductance mechanosensitive channel protein MscL [Anseongella sp.]|nr:large conductance mechanosensitive channel protein MscL [Anseongella sp.]
MGFIKEFKEFAVKGNVIDLAVAVVIGGAFGRIVTSLVDDIIMPPLGLLLGGTDFNNLFVSLDGNAYESIDAAREAAAPVLAYGSFIQVIIEFLIISLAIFSIIKVLMAFKKKEAAAPAAAPPAPTPSEKLLEEIRDLLKSK